MAKGKNRQGKEKKKKSKAQIAKGFNNLRPSRPLIQPGAGF